MTEIDLLYEHLKDLANISFNNNRYTYSDFLSPGEVSDYLKIEKELRYACPTLWGGTPYTERKMIRFGDPSSLGYDEKYPIVLIEISPLNRKFCDDLSHRDFLGALMNLGLERKTFGDIIVGDKTGYLFCRENVADYICGNLTKVKHTTVNAFVSEEKVDILKPDTEIKIIQVASERIDAIISKVYNLSRNQSNEFFRSEKVFLNDRECSENAKILKEGDRISVRGFGKMIYRGASGVSKKGKLNAEVMIYKNSGRQ